MNLDTTFLIDLHREYKRGESTGAGAFLMKHADVSFQISTLVVMEFLEGIKKPEDARVLDSLRKVAFEDVHAQRAALIRRTLREKGQLIGDLDICIAATALVSGQPLVTGNEVHFQRVEGLDVISYRKEN